MRDGDIIGLSFNQRSDQYCWQWVKTVFYSKFSLHFQPFKNVFLSINGVLIYVFKEASINNEAFPKK
jgi:hypothetical protein